MDHMELTPRLLEDEKSEKSSRLRTLRFLGRSAFTLIATPEHKKLHRTAEQIANESPQELLQPSLADTSRLISDTLQEFQPTPLQPTIDTAAAAGLLIQFTNHSEHSLPPELTQNYQDVAMLKDAFADASHQLQRPLDFNAQLRVALSLYDNNLEKSVQYLFLASRHYARWLDEPLYDIPPMSDEEKVDEMLEWRSALAACKPARDDTFQDTPGDTYYAWTHTYAQLLFAASPQNTSPQLAKLFRNGTTIMHSLVHSINKQSVPNDHTVAADYGNTIGDAIVNYSRTSHTSRELSPIVL